MLSLGTSIKSYISIMSIYLLWGGRTVINQIKELILKNEYKYFTFIFMIYKERKWQILP